MVGTVGSSVSPTVRILEWTEGPLLVSLVIVGEHGSGCVPESRRLSELLVFHKGTKTSVALVVTLQSLYGVRCIIRRPTLSLDRERLRFRCGAPVAGCARDCHYGDDYHYHRK